MPGLCPLPPSHTPHDPSTATSRTAALQVITSTEFAAADDEKDVLADKVCFSLSETVEKAQATAGQSGTVSSAKGLDSGRRRHRVEPLWRPIRDKLEFRHHPDVRSRCS